MKANTFKSVLKKYVTLKNFIFLFIIIYTIAPFVSQITSRFFTTYFYMGIVVVAVFLVFGACRLQNVNDLVFLVLPFIAFELLEMSISDEKSILLVGYRALLFIMPLCLGYYLKKNDFPIAVYVAVTLVTYAITAVTTIVGCMQNPGAARILATIKTSDDPLLVYFNWANIGGYSFVYAAVLLYPATIIAFKRRRIRLIFALIPAVLLFTMSIQAEYALSLTLLVFTSALFFIKRNLTQKGFFRLAVLFFATIIFFSSMLVALLNYVGRMTGNEEMTQKLTAIFSGQDSLNSLEDNRFSLYMYSLDLFIKNPIFGTYFSGNHVTGGHSFILDSLAHYGVVGAVLLFLMYRAIYKTFYQPFCEKDGYGFVIYAFLLPPILSFINTGMWLFNLCFFMPLFLMAIYGKDFSEKRLGAKYPRPAKNKWKEKADSI